MEFIDLAMKRRSCRRFADAPLSEDEIEAVLEGASLAPVGSNRREDIHLTVVTSREVLDQFAVALAKRAEDRAAIREITAKVATPASPAGKGFDPFYGAPAVIFVSHRRQDLQPGIEFANAMSVATYLHLQACDLGLGSVFMWGALEAMRMYPEYDRTDLLRLPDGFEPLIGVAVGHELAPAPERPRPEAFDANRVS